MKKKAFGLIYRYNQLKVPELLVLSFKHIGYPYYRLPGGGLDSEETFIEGCMREIEEESGIQEITLIRTLGKVNYFKPYINSEVEREDFLFICKEEKPDSWEYVVQGNDKDQGETFVYKWITEEEFEKIDPEFVDIFSRECIPELFK